MHSYCCNCKTDVRVRLASDGEYHCTMCDGTTEIPEDLIEE